MNLIKFTRLFPFRNIEQEDLDKIVKLLHCDEIIYERNEIVLSKDKFDSHIGFILSGECEVYKQRIKNKILIQTLKSQDSFGILTLFSEEEFPTTIVAKKRSKILYIDKSSFLFVLNSFPVVAFNVMTFMAERIQFLNKKISTLSGATVEERVKQFLLIRSKEAGELFDFNASRVAESLNIGRASIYRALDKLIENDMIEIQNGKIFIKRQEALKGL